MKDTTNKNDRFVIIMAGGRGERFWPISRQAMPKQLITLLGKRSFLQQAVDRVRPLVPQQNIIIITHEAQAAEVKRQLPKLPTDYRRVVLGAHLVVINRQTNLVVDFMLNVVR